MELVKIYIWKQFSKLVHFAIYWARVPYTWQSSKSEIIILIPCGWASVGQGGSVTPGHGVEKMIPLNPLAEDRTPAKTVLRIIVIEIRKLSFPVTES